MSIVEFKNVVRTYTSGDNTFNALDGIDLSLEEGKLIVLAVLVKVRFLIC